MYAVSMMEKEKIHWKELSPRLFEELIRLFYMLPSRRQIHLNSVTELAHRLMTLRMQHDANYPISGEMDERQKYLFWLLIAYNLHDIGDIPITIPDDLVYMNETASRREQIKQGDWISSGSYSSEKFDAPIRGKVIASAVHLALDRESDLPDALKYIARDLGYKGNESWHFSPKEHQLLDLIEQVAYQHHEYYDGKGWPRGIKLDPRDSTIDVTFFDFIAGWFVNKMARGTNLKPIAASPPIKVLQAIDKRQEESLKRNPGFEPMYNRHWVKFMRTHLSEVNEIVCQIFPDVAAIFRE